jgi:hypothetical protein
MFVPALQEIVHFIQILKTQIFKTILVIYNFIFIYMIKGQTMKLWFEFLNIHNEF